MILRLPTPPMSTAPAGRHLRRPATGAGRQRSEPACDHPAVARTPLRLPWRTRDGGEREGRGPLLRSATWCSAGTSHPEHGGSLLLEADEPTATAHARLAGWGPLDAVVDRSAGVEGAARRFAASFLHLRPGGVYRAPATPVVEELRAALV